MKFKLPGGEVTGAYRGTGEEWRVKADANGYVEPKDEEIAATLQALADDPDHPISAVKKAAKE
jgi:hypothetical protein